MSSFGLHKSRAHLMKKFKDFSIKTKFTVAFIIDGILIAVVALSFLYFSLIRGLDKIENYYLENEFHSTQTIIDHNMDMLVRNVKDGSISDGMYNYVNTHDKDWVKLNVTDWVPKNFKVDLILIFDATEKLIYQYGDFDEFGIGKDLSTHPLMKEATDARELKGFYLTSKGLAIVASSQIMYTNESGPRNGTYLYGKLINEKSLQDIKAITGIDISVISQGNVINSTFVGHIGRPKDFGGIYKELTAKKFSQFGIYKPDYQFAFVYSILKDIEGKDIGILELIRPRKSVALIREFFIKVAIWILLSVILAVAITVLAITTYILKPLTLLKETIIEIQKTKDLLKRAEVESEDEAGILAKNFNAMMDALNKSQGELIGTQQSLIKSERMTAAAELAVGTVHQINNPLSIVIGRVEMLQRFISHKTAIAESELEKDLKIIEEQTKRAVDITNSLLRYATPVMFRFERCDINELLKEVLSLIKEQFEAENITVIENLKSGLPFVQYCDLQQIKDVFMNIIINAQQAMTGSGKLEISTDYNEKDDSVYIKFTDNGHGIAPEDIKKLFTPFFSTKADKSGLGLAISYNIVKGHRGTIDIESEVGKGSTFVVKLPVGGGLKI